MAWRGTVSRAPHPRRALKTVTATTSTTARMTRASTQSVFSRREPSALPAATRATPPVTSRIPAITKEPVRPTWPLTPQCAGRPTTAVATCRRPATAPVTALWTFGRRWGQRAVTGLGRRATGPTPATRLASASPTMPMQRRSVGKRRTWSAMSRRRVMDKEIARTTTSRRRTLRVVTRQIRYAMGVTLAMAVALARVT